MKTVVILRLRMIMTHLCQPSRLSRLQDKRARILNFHRELQFQKQMLLVQNNKNLM